MRIVKQIHPKVTLESCLPLEFADLRVRVSRALFLGFYLSSDTAGKVHQNIYNLVT